MICSHFLYNKEGLLINSAKKGDIVYVKNKVKLKDYGVVLKTYDIVLSQTINDIKTKADEVITNRDLHTIVQDMASIQLLTIYVAKDLLEIYETNGAITQKDYNKVISKYEKQAKRLQKSLERYKNM